MNYNFDFNLVQMKLIVIQILVAASTASHNSPNNIKLQSDHVMRMELSQ